MFIPVIMAGGSGSRLWPLSREMYPKQFLTIAGDNSLLQETIKRLSPLDHKAPMVIGNEEHRFLIAEQLRQHNVNGAKILLEPEGRNTAPAITLAALKSLQEDSDPLLLVLAADHLIEDVDAFHASISCAEDLAKKGQLVTFGVVPTSAEVGYGYIQRGERCESLGFRVKRFVEKPDKITAEEYVKSKEYYWNSGMFLFRARSFLEELEKFHPDMLSACQSALDGASLDLDFIRLDAESFRSCPADSIDYAVMEQTSCASVVPLDAGWSDIGSWSALWEVMDHDEHGNAVQGNAIVHDTHNTMVHSDHRLVVAAGMDNVVIVETKDAVLVVQKDHVQDVKKIVERLKDEGYEEYKNHREIYRPWGVYDSIDVGKRYQVKRITVNPGAKLSLQMHHHRAEHWVVVSGTAKVTVGDESYLLSEDESTYIPVGKLHALENPGKIPLELVEVQSGSYLGEDDIVRFDDLYGRL